jgi:hypothetical protein
VLLVGEEVEGVLHDDRHEFAALGEKLLVAEFLPFLGQCVPVHLVRDPLGGKPCVLLLFGLLGGPVRRGRLVGDLDVVAPFDERHVRDLVDVLGVSDPEVLSEVLLGEQVVSRNALLDGDRGIEPRADLAVGRSNPLPGSPARAIRPQGDKRSRRLRVIRYQLELRR